MSDYPAEQNAQADDLSTHVIQASVPEEAQAAPARTGEFPEPDATEPQRVDGGPVPRSTGPRVGTVIWGLIVVAVGVAIWSCAAGLRIDGQLALIGVLAVTGVGLLTSSLVGAVRHRGRPQS